VASDRPQVELSSAVVVAGQWRNLHISEWRARSTTEQLQAIYTRQADIARRHGKVVTLSVVPGNVVQPIGAEMRATIEAADRELQSKIRAGALVLLAGGFGGAIIRSLMTSLNLLRRSEYPNKITATVEAACTFLAEYVDGKPSPAELIAIHQEIVAAPIRQP
jgi:hypothetical protein